MKRALYTLGLALSLAGWIGLVSHPAHHESKGLKSPASDCVLCQTQLAAPDAPEKALLAPLVEAAALPLLKSTLAADSLCANRPRDPPTERSLPA